MPERGPTRLIVTGATGYIGLRLVERALAEGRAVTVLGRRPGPRGTERVAWTLGDPLPACAVDPDLPLGDHALVHLAHDWSSEGADRNLAGTRLLFEGARGAGILRRVFISSQSARENALNRYGRTKWAIEQVLEEAALLRVGLVYGGPRVAMYGLLCRIVQFGPVLPMVDPGRTVQPIHRDEVVDGILAAIDRNSVGVVALAGPDPISFGDVLRIFGQQLSGRRPWILPVPLSLALLGCKLTRVVPGLPTIDRERVLGLAGTEPMEARADLDRLGVHVRPLSERLAAEPLGVRTRLREGRALLAYVVGRLPTGALLRRYIRATREGAIDRPRFLRWCEPVSAGSALAQRLRVASRLAEASATGERALGAGTRAGRLSRLLLALALDLVTLPTRLIATLVAR